MVYKRVEKDYDDHPTSLQVSKCGKKGQQISNYEAADGLIQRCRFDVSEQIYGEKVFSWKVSILRSVSLGPRRLS